MTKSHFPSFAYIGDAADVDENGQIIPVALSASSVKAKVKKSAKAVQITDEAILSGYGDPVGEAGTQLARAIDNHTDNDMLASLEGLGMARQFGTQADISPMLSQMHLLYLARTRTELRHS